MLLRDFLNEFELDWAQAAVRSGQIPQRSLKGARILLACRRPDGAAGGNCLVFYGLE